MKTVKMYLLCYFITTIQKDCLNSKNWNKELWRFHCSIINSGNLFIKKNISLIIMLREALHNFDKFLSYLHLYIKILRKSPYIMVMSKIKKILISLIGDPTNYHEANYHYNNYKKTSNFASSILIDKEELDKKILIGQYTLADTGNTFEDLQKESIKIIENKVKEINDFEKIISPGVFYSKKDSKKDKTLDFKGEIYNFYAYILYKLARIFEEIEGDVEVILDLTHGINYMGYLTFNAVNLILDIYSLVNNSKIKVVNSDPYPPGWKSPPFPDLNINVVLEKEIQPSFVYPSYSDSILRPYSDSAEEKSKLGKELHEKMKNEKSCTNPKYFINAINKGALLAAYTFSDDFDQRVNFAVDFFKNNIDIRNDSSEITVIPHFSFARGFESFVVAEMIKKISNIDKKSQVKLDELNKKVDIYKINPMLNVIVQKEIKSVSDSIQENCKGSWNPLSNILKGNVSSDPDERTFFAHAGLPGAFVEVNCDTGELRYRNDKLDKIKSFLS